MTTYDNLRRGCHAVYGAINQCVSSVIMSIYDNLRCYCIIHLSSFGKLVFFHVAKAFFVLFWAC